MTLPVTLEDGARGDAVSLVGLILGAVLPRAFAPGTPVALEVSAGDETLSIAGKTVGSKLRDDGRFDVRLRLVNLRKVERQALEAELSR